MKVHLSIYFCFWNTFIFAQNLAPNPSFEAFINCPPYPGQIQEALFWDAPNSRTTDYFHRCSPIENGASVPQNLLGMQEPHSGDAYTGIRTWLPIISGNPIYREYLSTKLIEPLQENELYSLSFWVSVAESSGYLSKDIGLWLSPTPFEPQDFYDSEPQLRYQEDQVLQNKETWQKISTTYFAKGGEQYLMLGNFLDDQEMTREEKDKESPVVYYYIDDVSVLPCSTFQDTVINLDTTLCLGETLLLKGKTGADQYQWENGSGLRERSIIQSGNYELVNDFGCYAWVQQFQVSFQTCDCQIKVPNPQSSNQVLQTLVSADVQSFSLQLFTASGQLVLTLENQLDPFIRLASGFYFWKASLACSKPPSKVLTGVLLIENGS